MSNQKLLFILTLLIGCSGKGQSAQPATGTDIADTSRFKKVIWVVFENEDFSSTITQKDFKKIATYGANLTNFHGEIHPSQGNYIAMTAGSALGINHDGRVNLSQNHIGDLLEAKHLSWKVYAEGYPGNCFTGMGHGNYVRKHNPFMSFINVNTDSIRCKQIESDVNYESDYDNNKIPEVSFFIPDINNDGHDTGVEFAGRYLTSKFGEVLSHPENLKDKLFIITFDESDGDHTNQIYTALIGGSVVPGSVNSQKLNHVALTKMIEDEFKLGDLGRDDKTAPAIDGIWK